MPCAAGGNWRTERPPKSHARRKSQGVPKRICKKVDAVATRVHTLSSLKEIAKKTGDAAQLSYPFDTTAYSRSIRLDLSRPSSLARIRCSGASVRCPCLVPASSPSRFCERLTQERALAHSPTKKV